jgi:hypothetical protein
MKSSSPTKTDLKQIEFDFDKVSVEPALQVTVALWTPEKRRALADKFERWAHELRCTANILEHRALMRGRTRPRLKRVGLARLALN